MKEESFSPLVMTEIKQFLAAEMVCLVFNVGILGVKRREVMQSFHDSR